MGLRQGGFVGGVGNLARRGCSRGLAVAGVGDPGCVLRLREAAGITDAGYRRREWGGGVVSWCRAF